MRGAAVVVIGSGDAVECSRRILRACKSRSLQTLEQELTRANRLRRAPAVPGPGESSLAEEQAELLDAIVGSLRVSISGHNPCADVELSLLGHLARVENHATS